METRRLCGVAHEVFNNLNDLNPKPMIEIFYRSPKSNSQKRQSLCSFPKFVHLGTHIEFIA